MAKNTMENGRFSFDILEHFLNMPEACRPKKGLPGSAANYAH